MWFKNLIIYRFTKPFTLGADALHARLQEKAFKPCGAHDRQSYGWVAPIQVDGAEYVHSANGYLMLCALRQEKVLPAQVVNEALEEKLRDIREKDGRVPGRKERADLKEELLFDLLPRAFTRSSRQYAYIAPREGWLVVNAASHTRAEELLTFLRDTLGSLPVVPLASKQLPYQAMTGWLRQGAPEQFTLGGECELRDAADEAASIRCRNQDLLSEDIQNHLKAGMVTVKIALSWQGGIDCVIDDKLGIKRLAFSDLIQEKAEEVHTDNAAEQFDVDFSIMTGEFARFIPALVAALGGEDLSAIDEAA